MTDDTTVDQRARAAAALRRLGHTLIQREADDDLLVRVAEAADRTTALLEQAPVRRRDFVGMKKKFFPAQIEEGERISHFDECFVSGVHNPLGIGIECRRVGDAVVADVELGAAFEGAPGRSHGGIVAAVFDDVLGYLLTVHNVPAFTGELTVRYLAPTPIGVPLRFRSWLTGREGRRLFCEAEATDEAGTTIGTASGVFVRVDPSQFRP